MKLGTFKLISVILTCVSSIVGAGATICTAVDQTCRMKVQVNNEVQKEVAKQLAERLGPSIVEGS